MRMAGVRMSQHADLSSRKDGNPWYAALGSFTIVCSRDSRGDLILRALWT